MNIVQAIRDLSDPDVNVRDRACETLYQIGPAASAAIPVLVEIIRIGEVESLFDSACYALVAIGEAAMPAVKSLAEQPGQERVKLAAKFIIKRINEKIT